MSEALHIGALAERSGRSVHTLRWYERQGLMPGVRRDAGGRRVYHPDHVEWLAFLDRLRATGMPVASMIAYADLVAQGKASLADRRALLQAHRETVEADLKARQRALDLIDAKIRYYREWEETGRRPAQLPGLD